MADRYIGLMSGTSLDGIDAVLIDFEGERPHLLASLCHPFSPSLHERLLALTEPGHNEIERMGCTDIDLARHYASAVSALLEQSGHHPDEITAIGSHGQTIRHRPEGDTPFTLQIGDPNTIAELTGITTVADFRRRDIAAGGQGAPLVPAFHAALFGNDQQNRVVVNIGGIANITLLPASGRVTGYDTGPGNLLLDSWCQRHRGLPYDESGEWARSGRVLPALLGALKQESYFDREAPKSCGRELFNPGWLDQRLDGNESPADVAATLVELTATTIANAIASEGDYPEVIVCGGGAANSYLMERLGERLESSRVSGSDRYGIAPDWVEAVAFAWLAKQTIEGLSGNIAAVTGAAGGRILGGIYRA